MIFDELFYFCTIGSGKSRACVSSDLQCLLLNYNTFVSQLTSQPTHLTGLLFYYGSTVSRKVRRLNLYTRGAKTGQFISSRNQADLDRELGCFSF